MPNVRELNLTPLKSGHTQEDVAALQFDANGMVLGDRTYMFVEGEDRQGRGDVIIPMGRFLSQRDDPTLALARGGIDPGGSLMLSANGYETVTIERSPEMDFYRMPVSVHDWQGEAVDQGAKAADWAYDFFERPARLVAVSRELPRYVEDNPGLGQVGFADAYAVTVASPESFGLLNKQLFDARGIGVPKNRMRTTMLLGGLKVPGGANLPPNFFPEDYVGAFTFTDLNGQTIRFERRKAIGRCQIPDVVQATGTRDKGSPVLSALTALGRHGRHADQDTFGRKPEVFCGQNFIVRACLAPGSNFISIPRGALLDVEYSDQPNWVPIA